MNYTITDERLMELFSNLMKEYTYLDEAERSYDYYLYDKLRYVDFNVINYYRDIDEDWEDDSWVFQVQYDRGDVGVDFELPILRYAEWAGQGEFSNVKSMFGKHFEPLLKEWFTKTYNPKEPIKTVTNEQD